MEYDRAIADFTRAIELDPTYAFGYRARALAQRLSGDYEKAVKDYSDLVRIRPDDFEGHQEFAWLLAACRKEGIRNGKRAVDEATRACELTEWKDSVCLDTLAAAYAEAGDFPAAVRWQTEAIKLHPDHRIRVLDQGLGFEGRLDGYKRGRPARE